MNNITTLKQKYLSVVEKLTFSDYFSLEIDGYIHESGYQDDSNIYIKYRSSSTFTSYKLCDNIITRKKGIRYGRILLGIFNGKSVIGNFQKNIYYCKECNKQSVDWINDVENFRSVSSKVDNCTSIHEKVEN